MDIIIDAQIRSYCKKLSKAPSFIQRIERSTYLHTVKPFDSSDHIQGRLLALLSHLVAPKLVIELGTFSGYAALCMMEGLATDGRIISIEHSIALKPLVDSHLSIAQSDNIEVKYGDAAAELAKIDESIDIIFIDAAKREYIDYYELTIDKVRPGGLIIADNVLWKNEVINSSRSKMAQALHSYNEMIAADTRVDAFILPYRDGISIARKL